MEYKTFAKLKMLIVIGFLTTVPFGCHGFFLEDIFNGIENLLLDIDNKNRSNTAEIINQTEVYTNTGNTIINGKGDDSSDREGDTKSRVHLKNIVNGKEVEPIDIESDAGSIKVKSEIETHGDKIDIHREVSIDSEKKIEDYQLNSENKNMESTTQDFLEQEENEDLSFFQKWWSFILLDFKSFFQYIFNKF